MNPLSDGLNLSPLSAYPSLTGDHELDSWLCGLARMELAEVFTLCASPSRWDLLTAVQQEAARTAWFTKASAEAWRLIWEDGTGAWPCADRLFGILQDGPYVENLLQGGSNLRSPLTNAAAAFRRGVLPLEGPGTLNVRRNQATRRTSLLTEGDWEAALHAATNLFPPDWGIQAALRAWFCPLLGYGEDALWTPVLGYAHHPTPRIAFEELLCRLALNDHTFPVRRPGDLAPVMASAPTHPLSERLRTLNLAQEDPQRGYHRWWVLTHARPSGPGVAPDHYSLMLHLRHSASLEAGWTTFRVAEASVLV